ncbi:MAG TPA: MFS transporter [Conexibacter sp.]
MLSAYGRLLEPPGTARLTLMMLLARIPIGIFGLAIVLLVSEHSGSFADAGVASAAWAIGAGLVAPLQGRLVDRFGQPAVLIPSTLLNAAAIVGVVVVAESEGPLWLLCALAAVGGAAMPPIGACMRSVWADVFAADAHARNTAYSFDSVVAELFFVAGPLLTYALAALGSPSLALLVGAALSLAGTLGFASGELARRWRSGHESGPRAGALSARGMRTLMLATIPTGTSFGVLEVAMPAFAIEEGEKAALAGVLLAAMAVGSIAGGLWYGARSWSSPVVSRYLWLHVAFTLLLLPLLVAGSVVQMTVAMLLGGLFLAPTAAAGYLMIDRITPPGTTTEATTWAMTSNVAGAAIGAALGGLVIQRSGVDWALALACAGPALGTLIALVRRGDFEATVPEPSSARVRASS